jgi:hypothetical protein
MAYPDDMFDLDDFDPEAMPKLPVATEDEIAQMIGLIHKAYGPLAPAVVDMRDHAEHLIDFSKLYGLSFEQMVADDFKTVISIAAMTSGGMN